MDVEAAVKRRKFVTAIEEVVGGTDVGIILVDPPKAHLKESSGSTSWAPPNDDLYVELYQDLAQALSKSQRVILFVCLHTPAGMRWPPTGVLQDKYTRILKVKVSFEAMRRCQVLSCEHMNVQLLIMVGK